MRDDKFSTEYIILYVFGLIATIWFSLLIAPAMSDGLVGLINELPNAMNNPFIIIWCENSLKTVLILVMIYGIGLGVYLSNERNYRRREEHGSAKWGNARQVNRKNVNKEKYYNKILTQNVSIGFDGRKHRRNLNTLVCGGSGAGKTRFYAKPNIMNANTSFVVLDPKGELLRDTGNLLKEKDYDI